MSKFRSNPTFLKWFLLYLFLAVGASMGGNGFPPHFNWGLGFGTVTIIFVLGIIIQWAYDVGLKDGLKR